MILAVILGLPFRNRARFPRVIPVTLFVYSLDEAYYASNWRYA
jgi:hypothetical protein